MIRKTRGTSGTPTARIDWQSIHRRLEQATAALERATAVTPAERNEILAERARELARAEVREQRREEQIEIVEFLLAHETYALESSFVREVYPLKDLTALPGTPAFVAGVINVRGRIVSVVDLKRLIDLPAKGLTDLNKVVIVGDRHMEFGLLADAMVGVRRIAIADIQPPPPVLTGIRADYLRGVTLDRHVILDVARLLADPSVVVRQATQA